MNASVSIQVRVPHGQARIIKRAAKSDGKSLAAYLREAALVKAAARVLELDRAKGAA